MISKTGKTTQLNRLVFILIGTCCVYIERCIYILQKTIDAKMGI